MSRERFARIRATLDRRQPDLTVVMEDVHKTHNLAAIARTCDAVGACEVHAIASDGDVSLTQRTAVGAQKWVDIVSHRDIETCFSRLRERGMRILVAHFDGRATDYRETDLTLPTAIVVGSELDGISDEALEMADTCVSVPMLGMVRSLNVSVATALILFEVLRQREAAGLYREPRLDPETYARLRFEWAQPDVADYCRREGLPYPELDEDGDVVGQLADREG